MKVYLLNLKKIYGGGLFLLAAGVLLGWGFLLSQFWGAAPVTVPEPIYQGSDQDKQIALTMNIAWGEEYMQPVLDILDEHKIKMTFFVCGQFAEEFPDIIRDIDKKGHEIGNHSYSHPYPSKISKDANLEEIKKTDDIILETTGKRPKLYAPPYGERADQALEAADEAGHKTIMWSIDTIDWQRPGPAVISDRVLTKAHNGAFVLMHPTDPTVRALPGIISELKDKGYELVTVSNMLSGKI